jgi:hypothetical protein
VHSKLAARILAILALLYALCLAALYAAMRQTPDQFGVFMSYVPQPALMMLPFRPLWMSARAGTLSIGDAAPDFQLATVDHKFTVSLSAEWQTRPVVLIFGSYT